MKSRTFNAKALAANIGVAAALGFGAVSNANATLFISFTVTDVPGGGVSTTSVTCMDNAACDTNPTTGIIVLANNTNPIPGFVVNGSTHTSVQSTGPGGLNTLFSGSSSVLYGGSAVDATLFGTAVGTFARATVAVGDTNFVGPSSTFTTSGSGTFVNAAHLSSIALGWYNNPANTQGALTPTDLPGNLVDSFNFDPTLVTESFAHNGSGTLAFPDGALYGMELAFTFDLVNGGSLVSRGQAEVKPTNVPEPLSSLLFGTALLGLGATRRRKTH